MSLIGALNIGKSALATQQAAIQVTGNNIANVGSADYTRQTTTTQPGNDRQLRPGLFVGTGIDLTAIQRQIDEALSGRLRGSVSDSEAADTLQQWMGRIEAVFNELSDSDLSTQLSTFFNSWSDLANKPQDIGLRQIVIQGGKTVAAWFTDIRNQLDTLQGDVDGRLRALAGDADQLAGQLAALNGQIVVAEGGGAGQANGLRDQRDTVLKRLSELMNIRTVQQPSGIVDVYVGSEPLVSGTTSRGVYLDQTAVDGKLQSTLRVKADNAVLQVSGGQLGALSTVRGEHLDGTIDKLDALAGTLIFELNKLHAAGQGLVGFNSIQSANQVDDVAVALDDPAAGLAFAPVNGSFVVHVRQTATGLSTSTLVQVDLDGLNGNDTSLADLATALDDIAGISASVVGGQLRMETESPNVQISFSQDSSGALAALGINSFFTGHDARDIAVSASIQSNPSLLAAAKNGNSADNQTARAIADLERQAVAALNGQSMQANYQSMVNTLAVAADSAKTDAQATRVVRETLQAQRESLSGVSLDEEAVNLMRQQRAFQAASRLIAAVDELMRTVLQMV